MTSTCCPTCSGSGKVPDHVATALNGGDHTGKTCSCDGPPHPWSPGWCPASGPVARR